MPLHAKRNLALNDWWWKNALVELSYFMSKNYFYFLNTKLKVSRWILRFAVEWT